jgi:hypothetical protein
MVRAYWTCSAPQVLLIDKQRSGRRALIADLQLGAAASGAGRSFRGLQLPRTWKDALRRSIRFHPDIHETYEPTSRYQLQPRHQETSRESLCP